MISTLCEVKAKASQEQQEALKELNFKLPHAAFVETEAWKKYHNAYVSFTEEERKE